MRFVPAPGPLLALALILAAPVVFAAPEDDFRMQCSACHQVDQALVGPSLVEIAGLYRNDADGFVRWCQKPGRKRLERIEMPSMAHVGEPALRGIREYILKATEGKKEKKPAEADPFAVAPSQLKRPCIQRIFLPDASPAAIAVALPGDLSFCFDATECRLRYVWKGGFIQGSEYWKGNGASLATIDGQVIYREEAFPFTPFTSVGGIAKFSGYTVKDGLPSFRYMRDGVSYVETIRPLADGSGIERVFQTGGEKTLIVSAPANVDQTPSGGTLDGEAAKSFTLTLRWKK